MISHANHLAHDTVGTLGGRHRRRRHIASFAVLPLVVDKFARRRADQYPVAPGRTPGTHVAARLPGVLLVRVRRRECNRILVQYAAERIELPIELTQLYGRDRGWISYGDQLTCAVQNTYPAFFECALVVVGELLLAQRKYVGTVRVPVLNLGVVALWVRNPVHRQILGQLLRGCVRGKENKRMRNN